jgi:uncharacterized protein
VFTNEHLQKMQEGLILFNQQKYWECHEALEEIWMEDRNDPVRNVYWAVIQVAAACIHYRDSNLIGAQGMIGKAKEKFKRCRDLGVLNSLLNDELNWDILERIVFKIPDAAISKLEDFKELFDFRFKKIKS